VARAVLNRVNDVKKMQTVQLTALEGETRADVERVHEYGFTSVPLEGAEAVAVFPGGFREQGLVIATDDRRYRLTGLTAGEVAIYTDQGDKVVIERGGTIRVTASTKVVIAAPLVELAGNTDAVALASKVAAQLTALKSAISGAVVVPMDGGASFKATLLAALASWPASTASTKVKAE
jgi:phage baseplate assembly protein V